MERIASEAFILGNERPIRDTFHKLGFQALERMVMSLALREKPPERNLPLGYEMIAFQTGSPQWSTMPIVEDWTCSSIQSLRLRKGQGAFGKGALHCL